MTEAQIYLTRKCNLNCDYCKLTKNKLKELKYADWIKAYRIMETIGIRTVKILGGEPTIISWLPDLLRFASRTSIKTAILSNSSFDENLRKKLADSMLWGYFASVDSYAVGKSTNGYQMLRTLKNSNIPLLAANVVISKRNYKDIPELVSRLSADGIWVNLCMIQHTNNSDKEFSKTDIDSDYVFTEEDKADLEELKKTLLQMKRSGTKISIPESYIEGITTYGINCNWQCSFMSQLRIDCDGGLMLCNEFRTRLATEFNILEMSKERYAEFLRQWKIERKKINCDGCYWSCFIQAEDNIKNGKEEFYYIA
jgi:MoaA/NifB/PqqE/SkfB family radical SAM enzyme